MADMSHCCFDILYICVMSKHDKSNLLFLMLQELTVVLVTLLPLASFNNSKDERLYVSKGLKVRPIFNSFVYDHFGCFESLRHPLILHPLGDHSRIQIHVLLLGK